MIRRKKGILVYVGLHRGGSFRSIFKRYKRCLGIEANPELFEVLRDEYKKYPTVHLYNIAATDRDGEVDFNISNNDGLSSSIGHLDEEWKSGRDVRFVRTVRVPGVNLLDFLRREGIDQIDDYISDIQGMDLEVLKTLEPLIRRRKIGTIMCEVAKDERRNVYEDLPDNSESGFRKLLDEDYSLVATGWGILKDGVFAGTPESWWEYDCKWRRRDGRQKDNSAVRH